MEKRKSNRISKNSNQSSLQTVGTEVHKENKPAPEFDTIFTNNNFTMVAKNIKKIKISDLNSDITDDLVSKMLEKTTKNTAESKNLNKKIKKKSVHLGENEELIQDIKATLESNTFQENEDFENIIENLVNKATAVQRNTTKVEQFQDEVLTISKILQEYTDRGITAVYEKETNTNDKIKIKIAANSCLIVLHLLWASNIFKRSSYVDRSTLQKVVDFTKNQIRTTIFSEYQNCSNKLIKGHQNIKTHFDQEVLAIYRKICEIITRLSKIIEQPTVLDGYCSSSLIFTAFAVFRTRHMTELQTVFVQLVVKIFSNQSDDPEISQLIMRELLSSNAPQINENYYTLSPNKPHLYTVLVLQIIHSKCSIYEENVFHGNVTDFLKNIVKKQLGTMKFCLEFIKEFLEKSINGSKDFEVLLKIFLGDLVALIDNPEWPAAVLLVRELSDILNDENTQDEVRNVCMDFVAQIVVKLKSIFTTLKNDEHLNVILQLTVENQNEEATFCLQNHILDFLEHDSKCDDVYHYALFFNMAMWMKNDFVHWICDSKNRKDTKKGHKRLTHINRLMTRLTSFNSRRNQTNYLQDNHDKKLIEYRIAGLFSQCVYFGSDLLSCCERYVHLLRKGIINGTSTSEISKALKGAVFVAERFPNTFSSSEVNDIVQRYAFDTSATIKELTVSLLGKYLIENPKLTDDYYFELLCEKLRSDDINVRKRSVEIVKEIHDKISSDNKLYFFLAKLHDDVKISKAILDIFQEKWFASSQDPLESVVDVVKQANNVQLKQIRSVYMKLYNSKKGGNVEIKTVKMISNAIDKIQNMLRTSQTDLCLPYFVVLHMIAKVNSKSIAKFAEEIWNIVDLKLRPTLAVNQIQRYLVKTIKLIIPAIDDEQIDLIKEMEMKLLKALGFLDRSVIKNYVSCLAKLVQHTKNYSIVPKFFYVNYGFIRNIDKNIENTWEDGKMKRSLLLVGLLIQIFDFKESNFEKIVEEIFQLLIRTLKKGVNNSIKTNILECLGSISVKYDDFLLNADFQNICFEVLKDENNDPLKIEILKMFKCYLRRPLEIQEYRPMQGKESADIKEIQDDTLGKPSMILQTFLKYILRSVISGDFFIRQVTLEIIKQIDEQGYVNPVEIIPFLVCISFDSNEEISDLAQSHLLKVMFKYPNFINAQCLEGITLSFKLHNKLEDASNVRRGLMLSKNGNSVVAVNDFVYKLLQHPKRNWRGLIVGILKQFDEKEKHNLDFLIFLADNLSAFSYKTLDELHFTIHNINELCVQYGASTLSTITKKLKRNDKKLTLQLISSSGIDLKSYIHKFRVYSLLLQVRDYLMTKFGVKEEDVRKYLLTNNLKNKESVIICQKIKCKPFHPEDVLNAQLEEKNNKKLNLKETFYKEFRTFQNRVQTDDGDEVEQEDKN